MGDEYQCAFCGGEFEASDGWTEEKRLEELKQEFGGLDPSDCDVVCDVCYEKIKPSKNPREFMDWLFADWLEERDCESE